MNNPTLNKIPPFLISAASLLFAGQFLYHTVQSSFYAPNILWIIFTLGVTLLTFIGLRHEFKYVKPIERIEASVSFMELLKSFLIVVLNTMTAFALASIFDVSTIFSTSLVCVASAYIFPKNEGEAYSGSIGGMIGSYLCTHWTIALLVGTVTGFTFVLFRPYFKGVGGRGGTVPYVATIFSVRLLLSLNPEQRAPIESELILPSLIAILFAALLTYFLHYHTTLTIVKSAMIIAFLSSVVIPGTYYSITTAIFAGTVVGMSANNRIESYIHLIVVAIICFILFIPSFHILDGIGGKLGILSLLAYQASIGLKIIVQSFALRFYLPEK